MNNENRYIISEERRIKLGKYIKDLRINKLTSKYGLNDFAEAVGVASSVISNLENGKIQKINPFLLQDISKVLGIDYKILYKIVGFLNEDEKIEIVNTIPKELLEEKNFVVLWSGKKREIIDLSNISKKGINELKNYIKYLSVDYREYSKFLEWKKEQKRQYLWRQAEKRYLEREEWNESSRYRILYDEESVSELFESNGLRLNDKGREFLEKFIFYYGEYPISEELKDKDGKELTGAKREYKLGKIVRYYATHFAVDFVMP